MNRNIYNRWAIFLVLLWGGVTLSAQESELTNLQVLSFNIRYDNSEDGDQQWGYRKEAIGELLESNHPHLIGAQEVLHHQLEDLQALLPQYRYIGVGRDDGKEAGEYAPIFYDTERMELLESGHFWLSETPDQPSIGWDAACPRIVTWALLYDKVARRDVACFNLHLDHAGEVARKESLELLRQKAKPYLSAGIPLLMMGDFNTTLDEAQLAKLGLSDSYQVSEVKEGPDWTFHDFGRLPLEERHRIDYILFAPQFEVKRVQVFHPEERFNQLFLSDHTPVFATLAYNELRGRDTPQYLRYPEPYKVVEVEHTATAKAPRNVVLMIGDGMSLSHVATLTALNGGKSHITAMASTVGLMTTHTADTLITDSAASATAMATGVKTNYHYLGVDPEGRELYNMTDFTREHGLLSGVISVCRLWDATPAAFCCHNIDRDDSEDVMADYLSSNVDLAIGAGWQLMRDRSDKRDLFEEFQKAGFHTPTTMEQLTAIKEGKIFATLAERNLPDPQLRGDYLKEVSLFALDYLRDQDKGFFLMIEGSQLDDFGHSAQLDMLMEETADFDRTVGAVVEWAKQDGETLVIVLADHETGGLTLVGGDLEEQKVTGKFSTGGHSGLLIPVYSYGPGAQLFGGVYDNTDIYHKITSLLLQSTKKMTTYKR